MQTHIHRQGKINANVFLNIIKLCICSYARLIFRQILNSITTCAARQSVLAKNVTTYRILSQLLAKVNTSRHRLMTNDYSQYHELLPCSFYTAGSGPDRCRNYQEMKIQEQVQKLAVGTIPRSMSIVLHDDLVDSCKPGDDVTIWYEVPPSVNLIILQFLSLVITLPPGVNHFYDLNQI